LHESVVGPVYLVEPNVGHGYALGSGYSERFKYRS
jgi:hypothetical protein